MQRQDRVATTGERILEDLCRSAEQGGRARLFDGDLDRAELSILHSLEVDEIAPMVDDRDRIWRRTGLGDFGDGRGRDLFRILQADRRAIRRRGSGCLSLHLTGKYQPGKYEKMRDLPRHGYPPNIVSRTLPA